MSYPLVLPDIVIILFWAKAVITPTYKRFSKPENFCDIIFLKWWHCHLVSPWFSRYELRIYFGYRYVIQTFEGESRRSDSPNCFFRRTCFQSISLLPHRWSCPDTFEWWPDSNAGGLPCSQFQAALRNGLQGWQRSVWDRAVSDVYRQGDRPFWQSSWRPRNKSEIS